MPPVREKDPITTDKTLKLGENLCKVLNLQDRRPIFIGIQRVIHQRVDQHFDLCRPSYEQQKNMQSFVKEIVNLFTGYFNPAHANEKQRLMSLQAYAGGYLDDKLVELSANEVLRSTYDPTFSKPKKAQSFETLQPASLPKGDIIKVIRPQPRPLRRSHKKKEPAVEVENSVMDVLPIESDPLEHEAAESSEVDESDYSVIGPKRRVSFSVPVLSPSPEPPSPTSPVTELLEIATDSITEFLENCYPSMVHCAPALRRAGVIKKDHLLGMARWSDDTLRNWLKKNDVACNALEEEALIIGFSCVLLDASRPASAMSL